MKDISIALDTDGFTEEDFLDVKLCLETLFSIRAGSQPLDRCLGIDYDGIIGYPANVAENMLALEIWEKSRIYEPRAAVESIEFDTTADGQIKPHIHFVKNDEEQED